MTIQEAVETKEPVLVIRPDGMATAAMIVGLVAVLSGLVFILLYQTAIVCGVLAIVLGYLGSQRIRERGLMDPVGKRRAYIARVAGVVAIILGIVGYIYIVGTMMPAEPDPIDEWFKQKFSGS